MRSVIVVILIALCLQKTCAQVLTSSVDVSAVSRPYCSFVFSEQELGIEKQKNRQNIIDLSNHFNGSGTHFISSLVKHFNGHRIAFKSILNQVKSQTVYYFLPYIVGIILLVFISLYWGFHICFPKRVREYKPQRQNRQILLKIQLALAGLALSLLFVIIMSIYGMNQSYKLELGVNQFFCEFFQQPTTFLRNKTGKYNLTWYATEIERFQDVFVKSQKELSSLVYISDVKQAIQSAQTLLQGLQESTASTQFKDELTGVLTHLQGIRLGSSAIKSSMQNFHLTVEYVRQVVIGYSYVLSFLEKEINKVVAIEKLSSFLSSFSQYLYLGFILVSLISMIGISGVTILQITSKYYIKDVFFYFMGVFSLIALTAAIVNSVIASAFLWLNDIAAYVLPSKQAFRKELQQSKFLNLMIMQVMQKFHPLSDGDYSTIYNGTFVKDCNTLSHNLQYFTSNININQNILKKGASYFQKTASNKQNGIELLQMFSTQLSSALVTKMGVTDAALKSVLAQMDQNKGLLGRLDSSALGRYINGVADYLLVPSINNSVQHRWIFGLCGYALILGLLFAYLINVFSQEEVRVHEGEEQKQSLSVKSNENEIPSEWFINEQSSDQCV